MADVNRFFRKRNLLILIVGLAIMQGLVCLLINRFMFHPVKGGYDKTLDGYVNIGTSRNKPARLLVEGMGEGDTHVMCK